MPKTVYDLVKSIARKHNIDLSGRAPAAVRVDRVVRGAAPNPPRLASMVRVAAPLARPCGSNTRGQANRYNKQDLVDLARASGIDPSRKDIDELCSILGISPHAEEVDLPKKACNSRARGQNRYTRDDVKRLAMARGIDIRGRTMTELCDQMGINREDVADRAASPSSSVSSSPVRSPVRSRITSPPRSPVRRAESLFVNPEVLERGLPQENRGGGVFRF